MYTCMCVCMCMYVYVHVCVPMHTSTTNLEAVVATEVEKLERIERQQILKRNILDFVVPTVAQKCGKSLSHSKNNCDLKFQLCSNNSSLKHKNDIVVIS